MFRNRYGTVYQRGKEASPPSPESYDDLVGRYGGEEFVLLVNGEVGGAHEVAERIRRAVQQECMPELEGCGRARKRPTY